MEWKHYIEVIVVIGEYGFEQLSGLHWFIGFIRVLFYSFSFFSNYAFLSVIVDVVPSYLYHSNSGRRRTDINSYANFWRVPDDSPVRTYQYTGFKKRSEVALTRGTPASKFYTGCLKRRTSSVNQDLVRESKTLLCTVGAPPEQPFIHNSTCLIYVFLLYRRKLRQIIEILCPLLRSGRYIIWA